MTQDYSLGPEWPPPPPPSRNLSELAAMGWRRPNWPIPISVKPRAKDWAELPLDQTHLCHDGACFPLLRHCVGLCSPGFALEFGVHSGHSLALISQHLSVVGFDSFQGLPEKWGPYSVGAFEHEPPNVPNSRLVDGWFSDTLPTFDFSTVQPLRLIHIDCDLYSSTKTVLEYLEPHLVAGVYVVFDEFLYDWPPNETRGGEEQWAWREFADRTQISWEVIGHYSGAWAIRIT